MLEILTRPSRAFVRLRRAPRPAAVIPLFCLVLTVDLALVFWVLVPGLAHRGLPVPAVSLTMGDLSPGLIGAALALFCGVLFVVNPLLVHGAGRLAGGSGRWVPVLSAYYSAGIVLVGTHAVMSQILRPLPWGNTLLLCALALWGLLLEAAYVRVLERLGWGRSTAVAAVCSAVGLALFFAAARAAGGAFGAGANRRLQASLAELAQPVAPHAIAGGENAAALYEEAAALAAPLPEDRRRAAMKIMREGWGSSGAGLSAELDRGARALELHRRAASMRRCDFAEGRLSKIGFDTRIPYPNPGLMDLTRLTLVRGRLEESRGETGKAAASYASALRVGRHLGQQRNFSLLGQMMDMLVAESVFFPAGDLLRKGKPSRADCAALVEGSIRPPSEGADLAYALREETRKLAQVDRLFLGTLLLPYSARTRKSMIEDYASLQGRFFDVLSAAARENAPERVEAFREDLRGGLRDVLGESRGGSWTACLRRPRRFAECFMVRPAAPLPGYEKLIVPWHVSRARLNILAAGAALRAYESAEGAAPRKLSELVPRLLAEVPSDPFNGFKPLRYVRRGKSSWLLYSLGPDRKDDGGRVEFAKDVVRAEWDWRNPGPGDLVLRAD